MTTRKLKNALPHLDRLEHYLSQRGWEGANDLTQMLKEATNKIERIERIALAAILNRLENFYAEEARKWAEDQHKDALDNPVRTTRVKQRKALVEYQRIRRTVEKIRKL